MEFKRSPWTKAKSVLRDVHHLTSRELRVENRMERPFAANDNRPLGLREPDRCVFRFVKDCCEMCSPEFPKRAVATQPERRFGIEQFTMSPRAMLYLIALDPPWGSGQVFV